MPKKKSNVSSLFAEKEKEQKDKIPEEVVQAVAEIIQRNDALGIGSPLRISFHRTVQYIKQEMNYPLSRHKIDLIVKRLGRSSWSHA